MEQQLTLKPKRKYVLSGNPRKPRTDSGKPRKPYKRHTAFNKNELFIRENASMPVSDHVKALGWEVLQNPAIYEIVSKSTKRRYIGCSVRPDLRRAVHLYWLKNYWKWGNSNVFFGNIQLARDIEKYGVEDFYLNIIKSFPKETTIKELKLAEAEFMREHQIKKSYNRNDFSLAEKSIKHYTALCEIEPEVRKGYQHFLKALKAREDYEKWFTNVFMVEKTQRRREIDEARKNKLITAQERMRLHEELSNEAVKARAKYKKIFADIKRTKADLRILISAAYKKYSKATKCLY